MSQTRQYSTFFVDQMHFGISVDRVQEALLTTTTTPVPLTTDVVDGLINLRGQIVLAIDLRARLHLPRRTPDQPSVSLVLRTCDGLISLRVDRLGDVLDLDTMSVEAGATGPHDDDVTTEADSTPATTPTWEAMPDTVRGPLRDLVQGVLTLEHTLLLVIDPNLLADPDVCLETGDVNEQNEVFRADIKGTT